jgi:hypothetical protein
MSEQRNDGSINWDIAPQRSVPPVISTKYTDDLIECMWRYAGREDHAVSPEFREKVLNFAALYTAYIRDTDHEVAAKKIEAELKEIGALARKLNSRLANAHPETLAALYRQAQDSRGGIAGVNGTEQALGELADWADEGARAKQKDKFGPQGAKAKKQIRREAVAHLATIWRDLTGKAPPITTDKITKRPKGPFFEFAVEALKPIFSNEAHSIEGDIRAAVRGMVRTKGK